MKRGYIALIAGLLLATSIAMALDEVYVSGITVIPPVAMPGDVVYVSASVKNANNYKIDDVLATLEQMDGNDLEITTINGKAEYLEPYGTATFSFAVKIPENPREKYLLHLKVRTGMYKYIARTVPIYTSAPTNLLIHSEESTVSAGECGYVKISLENTSNEPVQNIIVRASALSPIYVKKDITVGSIGEKEKKRVDIPVCTDRDALAGIYPITITVTYATGAGKGVAVRQVALHLVNEPDVIIAGARTDPKEVKEQQEYTMHILLQNTSVEPAYQVNVEIDRNVCNPKTSSGRVFGETPLYRGMYEEVAVHCKNGLPAGIQNIPIVVHYQDRYGRTYSKNTNIQIDVKQYPKVEIVGYKARNTATSEIGQIVVTLKNIGSKPARHVSVFIDPEWPFSTDEKRDYIDEILPGEERNAVLHVSVYPNARTKNYGLDVRLEYTGPDDERVTDTETLSISVRSTGFLEYITSWVISNWLFSIFSLVVLGGLAYLVVRAKRA